MRTKRMKQRNEPRPYNIALAEICKRALDREGDKKTRSNAIQPKGYGPGCVPIPHPALNRVRAAQLAALSDAG